MYLFGLFKGWFGGVSYAVAFGVLIVLFLLVFFVSFWQERTFYLCAVTLLGGGWLCFLLSKETLSARAVCLFFALFSFGATAGFSALCIADFIQEKRKAQAKKVEGLLRDSYFTLPDRENEFLKERLRTGLRAENGEEAVERQTQKTGAKRPRTEFALALLSRLREGKLSSADRLETENLSSLLSFYGKKSQLTSSELRAFNDCLACVLKLAAKYAL